MYTQTILAALLAAVAEASFGNEQIPIPAIQALSSFGQSGQAATLAGTSIQFLLAAANPCGKLSQADLIVSELGTADQVIAAARGLVAAEQNFNPFLVSTPSFCSDPTLPTTASLRGVVPLVDPSVVGSSLENANSNESVTTPFSADGLSVAQVIAAHGFTNFTAVSADGSTKVAGSTLGSSSSSSESGASSGSSVASSVASSAPVACGGTTLVTVTRAASTAAAAVSTAAADATTSAESTSSTSTSSGSGTAGVCTGSGDTLTCTAPSVGFGAVSNPVTGTFGGFQPSSNSSLDFGLCTPTLKFEAGLDGRATTEFTFQAQDPLCNQGQEEALNPVIIGNRIHDQLTNVCGASQATKDFTAQIVTLLGTLGKNASTAETWNSLLGFAGTNINPDNAPQTGLKGHT